MPPRQDENIDVEKGGCAPGKDDDEPQWHAMTKEDVCGLLGLSVNIRNVGLSTAEAKRRLEEYGENKLSSKEEVTLLQRIWKQVGNVLVAILVFVAVVATFKGIFSTDPDVKLTNFIEVGLIVFVIA
jgi:magnesium-transporting ATPase (P-type)